MIQVIRDISKTKRCVTSAHVNWTIVSDQFLHSDTVTDYTDPFIKQQVKLSVKVYVNARIPPDALSKRCNDEESKKGTIRRKHKRKKVSAYSLHNYPDSDEDSKDSSRESTSSVDKKPKRFKWMTVSQPVNSKFRESLYYRTYRLKKTSKRYERNMARKICRMEKIFS